METWHDRNIRCSLIQDPNLSSKCFRVNKKYSCSAPCMTGCQCFFYSVSGCQTCIPGIKVQPSVIAKSSKVSPEFSPEFFSFNTTTEGNAVYVITEYKYLSFLSSCFYQWSHDLVTKSHIIIPDNRVF